MSIQLYGQLLTVQRLLDPVGRGLESVIQAAAKRNEFN